MPTNPDRMGRIEPQRDERLEQEKAKLRGLIEADSHLKALTQIINNKFYPDDELSRAVSEYNNSSKDWVGGYVEEIFSGVNGRTLKIMKDRQDHIRLSWSK